MRRMLPLWLAVWAPAAHAFPADSEWLTVSRGVAVVADGAGDDAPDLFGDADFPGLYWFADESTVSFRVRLAGAVVPSGQVVALLVSTDGDDETLEFAVLADGPGDEVGVYTSNGVAGSAPAWTRASGQGPLMDRVVVTGDLFDFEVPRSALEAAGWTADLPAKLWVAGGSTAGGWTDLHGCVDLACAPQDILTAPIFIDQDLDGLTNPAELALGLPPADADADDDGLLDGEEALDDGPDQDGLRDVEDCDSDGDALRDGLESGVVEAHPDTNLDAGCFVADVDGSTTTNVRSFDSDSGGLADAVEDVNRNGAVDAWETDPNNSGDDVDSDFDGIADVLEAAAPDASVDDVDSDGDGVSDAAEWLWDIDGDGVPAFIDDDSDGDGFSDVEEGEVDTDEDGWVDAIDPDSDGDGRRDVDEGRADLDCDGIENRIDPNDFDGYCDEAVVDDGYDDETVSRPPGELGGCQHGSGALWLALWGPWFIRRRR